jgi:uncharacterized membrane protein
LMDSFDLLRSLLTPLDMVALAFYFVSMIAYRTVTDRVPSMRHRNLVGAVQRQRDMWLRNMSRRDNRNMDIILLGTVGQGNAFFASTTAIAIGGIAALMGSGERAQSMLEKLPLVAKANPMLWECKLLLIMSIFIFAFFKFAWAFRLSHYAAIMIGATPILAEDNHALCDAHAERTAGVAGLSAEHANGGLRSFYYAFAVLAWFFHPVAFIVATLWVLIILVRRDYYSRSLRLLTGI